MIQFIDEYRNRFTIELMCTTLKNNRKGGVITSRDCRQSKARGMSACSLRGAALIERLRHVHADNYGVHGVLKMCRALGCEGIAIDREHTARLTRTAGLPDKAKAGHLYPRKPRYRTYSQI